MLYFVRYLKILVIQLLILSGMYLASLHIVYTCMLTLQHLVSNHGTKLYTICHCICIFHLEYNIILRILFVTHIFIGYSTLNVSIYSENRRGIYVRFRSPSFGPQKTITTWLTKREIFTLH